MTTAQLVAAALATRRTVRITTVRGVDDLPDMHYVALMLGDQVLVPIGPGPLPEVAAEAEAATQAALWGVDVSRRDCDDYDPWVG